MTSSVLPPGLLHTLWTVFPALWLVGMAVFLLLLGLADRRRGGHRG